jgi:hypothetical protein
MVGLTLLDPTGEKLVYVPYFQGSTTDINRLLALTDEFS